MSDFERINLVRSLVEQPGFHPGQLRVEDVRALLGAIDLVPNPRVGFSCGGVNIQGDSYSMDKVRAWHHDATEVLPALRRMILSERQCLQKAADLVEYDRGGRALVYVGDVYPPTADGYRVTPLFKVIP